MESTPQEALERAILRRLEARDLDGAATVILQGYGREIFSFLAAMHKSEHEASDVFSMFAEGVWRGLDSFDQRSSSRTWVYAIARRCSLRYRRDQRRRDARFARLPEGSALSAIAEAVRTETLWYLRTEQRDTFAALRSSLSAEDQEILVLRVDRRLAWSALAEVLHENEGEALEGEALKMEAARLRKRFQLLSEKLREMGRRAGLLPPDNSGSSR